MQEEIDKLDGIKIQNICSLKDTFKRIEDRPQKVFAKHMSDKGFI